MALKLTIAGQQADLGMNQSITLKQLSDFFNLEVVEATVSLPFDLPFTQANRKIFGYVDIPASAEPMADELEASIEVDGALLRSGFFVLNSIRDNFEGYFKADAGVFSSVKDKLIGEFVDDMIELDGSITYEEITEDTPQYNFYKNNGIEYVITSGDPTAYYQQLFDGRYDSIDSDIVFPAIYRRSSAEKFMKNIKASFTNKSKDFVSAFGIGNGPSGHVLHTDFLPCIKLKYIFERILASQDYRVDWQADDYTVNQAILFADTPVFEFPVRVGDLMPELKVSEFINSLRTSFGLAFAFDSKEQVCTVRNMEEVLQQSDYLDLTDYVIPDAEIERIDSPDGEFSFSWNFENSENRTGDKLPPMPRINVLPADNVGKLLLVQRLNAYHKAEVYTPQNETGYQGVTSFWRPGFAVDSAFASSLYQNVKSSFAPAPNLEVIVWEQNADVEDNNGAVLLRNTPIFLAMEELGEFPNYRVRIMDLVDEYGDAFHITSYNHNIIASGTGQPSRAVVSIDQLNYVGEHLQHPIELYFRMPHEDTNISGYMEMPEVKTEWEGKAIISLWHGVVNDYRFASSGNYTPDEQSPQLINDTALRWEESDGIINKAYPSFIGADQTRKLFRFDGFIKLSDVLNFNPLEKVLIDHVKYLPIRVESVFRGDRRNDKTRVEIELRRD